MDELKALKTELISANVTPTELHDHYHHVFNTLSLTDSIEITALKFDIISIILLKLTKFKTASVQVNHDALIQIIFNNLDRSSKSLLIYATNNLINKFVDYFRISGEKTELIVLIWIDKLIEWFNNSKQLLLIIETLIRCLEEDEAIKRFYDTHLSFVHVLFRNFKSDALANSSNKILILTYKKLERSSPENWFELWDLLVYEYLIQQQYSKNLLIYLFPQLFQINTQCLQFFIDKHFTNEIRFVESSNEAKFKLLVSLLKIGQDLSIDPRALVKPDFFPKCLSNGNTLIRLNTLNLLCYSAKSSNPITQQTFSLLQENLPHLFWDIGSIDLRNGLINTLSSFIIRVRDSSYNLYKHNKSNPQIKEAIEFMNWFILFLTTRIAPTASYSQNIISLNLLNRLIDLNLDSFHNPTTKLKSNNLRFPYVVDIFTQKLIICLFSNVNNDFEDVRKLSTQILFKCPDHLTKIILSENLDHLIDSSLDLCFSLKSRKCEGGAYCFQVLVYYYCKLDRINNVYDLFKMMLRVLKNARGICISDPFENRFRIHGIVNSLKLMLEILPKEVIKEDTEFWSDYFREILEINRIVWESIKVVIANCEESTEVNEEKELDNEGEFDDDKLAVKFSWKFIKESTHLINLIFTINNLNCDGRLLPANTFLTYLDLLVEQISVIKHRGAFSSIYPCFISNVNLCFYNPSTTDYPRELLLHNIELISNKHQRITRRSGGLPFLITGVLTSFKSNGNCRELMQVTFKSLIDIIENQAALDKDDAKIDLPQVNALNCIKSMLNDSVLAAETAPFINRSLILCLSKFTSNVWSIKNSALMLFASIKNKLVTSNMNSNNKLLSVNFFKDESMKVLVDENLTSQNLETVFAILSILIHINFVNDEENLLHYKELLFGLLLNKNWKVRQMIARTISTILLPNMYYDTIGELISFLSGMTEGSKCDYNLKHGVFMAVLEITKNVHRDSVIDKALFQKLVFLSDYTDWSNLKEYIEMLHYLSISEQELRKVRTIFLNNLSSLQYDGLKQLAMNEMLQLMVKFESGSNLTNVLELALELNHDFTVIASEVLLSTGIKIDSQVIWHLLVNSDLNYMTERYLSILCQWPQEDIGPQYINRLRELVNSENEEVSSKALEVFSKYCPEGVVDYLLREQYLNDEIPEPVRLNSLSVAKNVILYCSDEFKVKGWFMMFKFLTDSSEDIRLIAAKYVSAKTGTSYLKTSYVLLNDINKYLITKYNSKLLETEVVDRIVNYHPSVQLKLSDFCSNINDETGLFDIEILNEYRNDGDVIKKMLELAKQVQLSSSSVDKLVECCVRETDALINFLTQYQTDGLMGYTRYYLVYSAFEHGLANLGLVLLLIQNARILANRKLLTELMTQYNVRPDLQEQATTIACKYILQ